MWTRALSLLLAVAGTVQALTLEAQFSSGGVKGKVTFTQANAGDAVSVAFTLSGLDAVTAPSWQLHTFRLHYDYTDRCSLARLGDKIGSYGGAVANIDVNGLELSGPDSIEGRSIAVLNADGAPVACATIERPGDYFTARAVFRKGVLGHVVFRQSTPTTLTRVNSDLFFDGSRTTAGSVEWRIVDGGDCSAVGTAFNPGSITGACLQSDHSSCAVGDLQGKLGTVTIGVTMGTGRKTSVDLNLPLSGGSSVSGKSVQLFETGQSTPLACATIRSFVTRTGMATFDNDGIYGSITFTQRSPLDPTSTHVSLSNLRSQAGGYHVHSWPVPQRLEKNQAVCNGASVSGHHNPFGIVYDSSSPAAGASTEDMYEVGDLSKKYGMLSGKDALTETYRDFNLPLFGANSILGRSVVIHYDQPNSPRWVCANIDDTAAVQRALAVFTYPVIGYALLQQRVGEEEEEAETSIYLTLDYGDGSTDLTSGHSWAVHSGPAGDDFLAEDAAQRCLSAGVAVYDPYSVSSADYSAQCGPGNPLRCKLGDLKNKHGALRIRGGPAIPAIKFFTDVSLPLQGANGVLGKALVIKAASGGDQNLACANLRQLFPVQAEAAAWGEGATSYGVVTFTQQVGVIQQPTTIQLNLSSLPTSGATTYHVDYRPVSSTGDRCGHMNDIYNPFDVDTSGPTKDQKKVGDLSGKFGSLSGATASDTLMDPNLDLWGPRSVLGHGLTLTSGGNNIGCSDVTRKMASGGMLFEAKAVFDGYVTGHIILRQFVYTDGAITPTTAIVDLRNKDEPQTSQHKWHVHEYVVGDDASAAQGRCSSTAGHYNPFMANVAANYAECGLANQLRCELGDQSGKLGTYDMGSGPIVATDSYLPLAGQFNVIGRSIVVHQKDLGAGRIACADIFPADTTNSYLINVKSAENPVNRRALINQIAGAINTEPYNLAVKQMTLNDNGCAEVRLYFLGLDAAQLSSTYNTVVGSDSSKLGAFQPTTCSAVSRRAVSLVLLSLACILGRLLR